MFGLVQGPKRVFRVSLEHIPAHWVCNICSTEFSSQEAVLMFWQHLQIKGQLVFVMLIENVGNMKVHTKFLFSKPVFHVGYKDNRHARRLL